MVAPCPPLETVVWHDLFLGRPRSRRYPKFNIRRDIPDYLDLVGPAIPLADEMGAGRNGPCGSGGAVAWRPVRHGSQSAPGCGRMPAKGPALAFVRKNAAHENARERAWGSSPKGLLPDPP